MSWYKDLLPVAGVVVGFGLSETGKYYKGVKEDRKSLKKLVFYFLELRLYMLKDQYLDENVEKILVALNFKMEKDFGVSFKSSISESMGLIKETISKHIKPQMHDEVLFGYLVSNIDVMIDKLSEIDPILSYELSGQQKIKERLRRVESYMEGVRQDVGEDEAEFVKKIIPHISMSISDSLRDSIIKMSKRFDFRLRILVKRKLKQQDKNDFSDLTADVGKYVDEVMPLIINQR